MNKNASEIDYYEKVSTTLRRSPSLVYALGVLTGIVLCLVAVFQPAAAGIIALLATGVMLFLAARAFSYYKKCAGLTPETQQDSTPADFDDTTLKELMSDDFSPKRIALGEAIAMMSVQYKLSAREKEILVYLVRGRDVKHISEALTLSVNTVRTHVSNVYSKVGVHSRQELIDTVESFARDAFSDSQAAAVQEDPAINELLEELD